MKVTAAVLYEPKKPLVIEELDLLDPGPHEVQVRWAANGVCHSDYHLMSGDVPHPLPVVLGHEASGVVERVGPGVETVKVGDHVCSSYIPSCGKCGYCIGGQPTMCALRDKPRHLMLDGTTRFRKGATSITHYLQVAGFATHSVLMEESVIPVRKDAPLDVVSPAASSPAPGRSSTAPRSRPARAWPCGGAAASASTRSRPRGSWARARSSRWT
jgi:S-(hydroxymethyl)glutathione dehydrogenase / alcohol dehydrogenase